MPEKTQREITLELEALGAQVEKVGNEFRKRRHIVAKPAGVFLSVTAEPLPASTTLHAIDGSQMTGVAGRLSISSPTIVLTTGSQSIATAERLLQSVPILNIDGNPITARAGSAFPVT